MPKRLVHLAAVVLLVACLHAPDLAADTPSLPALPGIEDEPVPAPLPGSTFSGENPLNAVGVDTAWLLDAVLARGVGIGLVYERGLGTIGAVSADLAALRLRGSDGTTEASVSLLSLLAWLRAYILASAVNGPNLGVSAGTALAWCQWNGQAFFFVWPQFALDGAMKFSLGNQARGLYLEPHLGYRLVLRGAETAGLPIPRYGGLSGGIRVGLSL